MKRPFVIDCDTGTDDAVAIIAALGCPDMEIVGITSVNGNVAETYTSENNLNLIEYLGRTIPVAHGAWLPLGGNQKSQTDPKIHGKNGLGTTVLPSAVHSTFDSRYASEFIYEEAVKRNGELELLVTGPMTNIAITLIEHPDLPSYIKHLYFMGGSTIGGNVNTSAEFNIWADPEALYKVLVSGMKLTMVGLNVSNLAIMTETDERMLRSFGSREAILTADLLKYMMGRTKFGDYAARQHDSLALAAAMFPECMTYEDYYGEVELNGTCTRGHTAIDIYRKKDAKPNVSVAMKIDVPLFTNWLIERIRIAGEEGEKLRK